MHINTGMDTHTNTQTIEKWQYFERTPRNGNRKTELELGYNTDLLNNFNVQNKKLKKQNKFYVVYEMESTINLAG